jgi:hypothetical protein
LKFGRKHIWKVLYKVSSKQNDRWVTQVQHTDPLVYYCTLYYYNSFFMEHMKSGPDLDELREVLSYSTCEAPPQPHTFATRRRWKSILNKLQWSRLNSSVSWSGCFVNICWKEISCATTSKQMWCLTTPCIAISWRPSSSSSSASSSLVFF